MAIYLEQITPPRGQSIRFLRWRENANEVEIFGEDAAAPQRVKGAGTRWHFHPEMEITLITKGEGTRFIGDHIGGFSSPELVLLGPNLPHYWRGPERSSSGYAIQFQFPPGHAFWSFPESERLGRLWQQARRGIRLFDERKLAGVRERIEAMTGMGGLERLGCLLQIFGLFLNAAEDERELLSGHPLSGASSRNPDGEEDKIAQAVRYILERFQDDIALPELLDRLGMSKPTFSRHFKNQLGRPFSAFLGQVRVDFARQLLVRTDSSVAEIAYESGFRNLSHFNALFRKSLGKSPTQFRREHREG